MSIYDNTFSHFLQEIDLNFMQILQFDIFLLFFDNFLLTFDNLDAKMKLPNKRRSQYVD